MLLTYIAFSVFSKEFKIKKKKYKKKKLVSLPMKLPKKLKIWVPSGH